MPEMKVVALCDSDNSPLAESGGYYNLETKSLIAMYTCPHCSAIYFYDPDQEQFTAGKWKAIIDANELRQMINQKKAGLI